MFTKNEWKRLRHLKLVALLAAAISLMVVPSSSNIAMAATPIDPEKAIDPGIGCGFKYWGIKTSPHLSGTWQFGKNTGCTDQASAVGGRTNYVKIYTFLPGDSSQQFAIDWQAIIQGKDPWGNDGSDGGGIAPLFANMRFPTLSTNDYTLKAQWYWTNDEKPLTDKVNANYLTNLWLANSNSFMVIDFVWMQLKSTGSGPYNWQQNIVTDVSSAPGTQVYQPYCAVEGGPGGVGTVNVFHYNVVLDNTSHGSNQWIEKIANINSYLNDATSYGSYQDKGCDSSDLGTRSSYSITGIETGIEVSAQDYGKSGKVKGYFSNSNLYYAGMEIRSMQLGDEENPLPGLNAVIYNPSGVQVANGFTPFFYKPTTTGTYTVKFNDYGEYYYTNSPITGPILDYNVYNWGGSVQVQVSSTSNGIGVDGIYYKNSDHEGNSRIQFRATDGSNPLSMRVTIEDSSGNTLSKGFTPITIGIPANEEVTVIWNDYSTHDIYDRNFNTTEHSWQDTGWGAIQVIETSNPGGGSNYYDEGEFT